MNGLKRYATLPSSQVPPTASTGIDVAQNASYTNAIHALIYSNYVDS